MFKLVSIVLSALSIVQARLQQRDTPPPGFLRVGQSSPDKVLSLRLALTQQNISALHDAVYAVSTPGSVRYGQYLTKEEVEQLVAPSETTMAEVNAWLKLNGLTSASLTSAGDWIEVNMTVGQANELFSADFATFQNQETNRTVDRTLSYAIPSQVEASISSIYHTIDFPSGVGLGGSHSQSKFASRRSAAAAVLVSPPCAASGNWTPACIEELYDIPSTPAKPVANLLGVSGFELQFANQRDLAHFLADFRPDVNVTSNFELISVDGGINNQLPAGAGMNAAVDIQTTMGLATGVPAAFISTGIQPQDLITSTMDQVNFLLSMDTPPQTIVNTYNTLESMVSTDIEISLCNSFAQLAARGVSYIVTTGGLGAGGSPFSVDPCVPFDPPFPATCPFVTAVGGTLWPVNATGETGAFFSGGGFSRVWERPDFQDAAVSAYVEGVGATSASGFNISGRAIPDLSALSQGQYYLDNRLVSNEESAQFGADIVAAIVALLNNARIAAGKPTLGLLNPLLYQNSDAFNDILSGSTLVCESSPGFNATAGWDPVTGLGSPDFSKLQRAALNF